MHEILCLGITVCSFVCLFVCFQCDEILHCEALALLPFVWWVAQVISVPGALLHARYDGAHLANFTIKNKGSDSDVRKAPADTCKIRLQMVTREDSPQKGQGICQTQMYFFGNTISFADCPGVHTTEVGPRVMVQGGGGHVTR